MIGTHNSGTGEKSHLGWRYLFTPFCRCQDSSIVEQYNQGVRYFDFRIRKRKGDWVFAHGIWESRYPATWSFIDLNGLAARDTSAIYCRILYEGTPSEKERKEYLEFVEQMNLVYPNIIITFVGIKIPWERVAEYDKTLIIRDKYHILDANHGKRYLFPCPWFWWIFRTRELRKMDNGWNVVNLCDFY